MENTLERIIQIIAEMFGKDAKTLCGETRLVQELNIKSANRINLSVMLEETFDIEIGIYDILKLQTIQEISDLVDRKMTA